MVLERLSRLTMPTEFVIVEQARVDCRTIATPPLPAQASLSPGTHQMTPDSSLYPFFDQRETSESNARPEIVHPATQYRIDPLNHDFYRHGLMNCRKIPLSFANSAVRFFSLGA
jgi:hypothetical protein